MIINVCRRSNNVDMMPAYVMYYWRSAGLSLSYPYHEI